MLSRHRARPRTASADAESLHSRLHACPESVQPRASRGLQDVCGNTAQSWQGRPAGAPPVASLPAHGADVGIEPRRASETSGRFITTQGSLHAPPSPPWPTLRGLDAASVLPLGHAQGDVALPAPIDEGAYRRPFEPTRRTWSLPAPPAPDHGFGCPLLDDRHEMAVARHHVVFDLIGCDLRKKLAGTVHLALFDIAQFQR